VVKQDLREPDAARRLVDATIAAIGRIDILVNNAAAYGRTPLGYGGLTDQVWNEMMDLNAGAPMRLSREAVVRGATVVVNIADISAWQPWANWAAYASSKAALLHLTKCLALELAPTVRVNAVAPGTVLFPDEWDDARRAAQLQRIPLRRIGDPTDVARAVRFLVEEDYLTGVCIPVDGGAGLR
jgi:pteridine reductase